MHFDYYACDGKTFFRVAASTIIDWQVTMQRSNWNAAYKCIQERFQYARPREKEMRRTMQRSIRRVANPVAKNESAFTFIEFQRRSFVLHTVLPWAHTEQFSAEPRPMSCDIVTRIIDDNEKKRKICRMFKNTACCFIYRDTLLLN